MFVPAAYHVPLQTLGNIRLMASYDQRHHDGYRYPAAKTLVVCHIKSYRANDIIEGSVVRVTWKSKTCGEYAFCIAGPF